jgi:hypothetical protein
VGQAKRRHVLRYLAARERAGIIGTEPFDLDEALVRLDARLAAGCRWALAVAVELALTGQPPGCKTCAGAGTHPSHTEVVHGIDGRAYTMGIDFAACRACRGTGHNTSAALPWPAWLRRKGQAMVDLHHLHGRPGGWAGLLPGLMPGLAWHRIPAHAWILRIAGEAKLARPFPRGAHESHDPWQALSATPVSRRWHHEPDGSRRPVWERHPPLVLTDEARWPAWLRGLVRHADQRRDRARRSADKAERARRAMRRQGVEDLLRGSLTAARAATASDPAEQTRLAVEAARLYAAGALGLGASTLDESPAFDYAIQQQRISGNSLGLADRLRVPLDVDVLQRGTVIMSVDGTAMPVTIADGVMRLDSGQRLTVMPDGSVTAHVRSWHRRLQTLGDRTPSLAVHVAVERARGDG